MNTMIFNVLLVAVAVGLVSADFTCPDGVVTCATDKACCFQSNSGYSCCDKPDDDADLIPGTSSVRQRFSNQSLMPFTPQQSSLTLLDFCPDTSGKRLCCDSDVDTITLDDCQENSGCCDDADHCCMGDYICCYNQWCCKNGYQCGPVFNTCKNGVVRLGAQGIVVIVAVALAVFKFTKI